jgi:hypothetical protein
VRAFGGLGRAALACYGARHYRVMGALRHKGIGMAEEEPLLVSPPTREVASHVRDYERFTRMLKWSALTCLVIAFIVLLILK